MNFRKTNIIVGWIVCAIATTVFILTREATVSFWDCGEFIPCAYKLQISHPPGAPLFILLGRFFIILFGGSLDATTANLHAARQVNLMSSVSSGLAVLFLFWTITHMARKMMTGQNGELSREKMLVVLGAGAVGALAFAFSDSFWFSAVEGIVFGVSPLFISMAFWAILKWEEQADRPRADRWIIFIAYLIGLSIGVHLLSLLGIPALVMTYYFRKFKYSTRGAILALVLACALTVVVQILLIQGIVKIIGGFELLFVNDFGLPFNLGSYCCLILITLAIVLGLRWTIRKGHQHVELAILSFAFILIGYSTYAVILIRANAEPAINMQTVNNPIELVAYLDRSQYGQWPIFRGADFTAKPTGTIDEGNIYYKNESTGKYEVVGKKIGYSYDADDIHFFPRIWDTDNTQGHVDMYKSWLGLDGSEPPSTADNLRWLMQYQFNWMYIRYFMWNFAGRQNDLQGLGNPRDGNWISGIPFIDNWRLGDQSKMPDTLQRNKARAPLFMLPLILGILGLFFQYKKDRKNAAVVFLLYFCTGIAIILYLNQAGPQPRERDYSYVGSFYAFSIWIGLGVLFLYDLISRRAKIKQAGLISVLACLLAVPALMIGQEWKAHDRSQKTLARDAASDYLNSCAPESILYTGGDNDTYPLWYAQEVENIRPDVRVIITSLLGTDWMIDKLKRKVNQSDTIPMSWSHDKYEGDNRNYVPYFSRGGPAKDSFMNLNAAMTFMASDSTRLPTEGGESMNYLPTKNLYLPVDRQTVLKNGTLTPRDSAHMEDRVSFTVPVNGLFKNDLMELNIMAADQWKRPIYFTQPYGLGLNNYVEDEGLAYRLMPVKHSEGDPSEAVNVPVMYDNLMNKFRFGGAEKRDIYFDENGRRILLSIRRAFAVLANALAAMGNRDSALQVLNRGYTMIQPSTLPYGMVSADNMHDITSLQYAFAYFQSGDSLRGQQIADQVIRDCQEQLTYYQSLPEGNEGYFSREQQSAAGIMKQLQELKANFARPKPAQLAPQKLK